MKAVAGSDELRRNSKLFTVAADRTLDDVSDAQFCSDFANWYVLALEIECRRSRRDEQIG